MATRTHIEVVMPQMGVSVSEGTIVKWLLREGQTTKADEPLLEISTDKVDTEVPSPVDGILERIVKLEGETVAIGTTIALIVPAGEAEIPASKPVPTAPEPEIESVAVSPAPQAESSQEQSRAFVSPVVARIAAEHAVDLELIAGSGLGGRVTKKDILAHLESGGAAAEDQPARAPKPPAQAGPIGDQLEAMSQMRRSIAEHMRRSLDTAAHATTVFEVDMSRVVAIRERLKPDFLQRHGVRLTYLSFVARATVEALRNWPWLNAEIRRNEEIVTHSYINLSVAVAVEGGKGLVVPVIRNAEGLNLLGMARAIQDIGDRARSMRLVPEDVQGGTFTITNPGGHGSIVGTPIINQPQVAILDTEALVKRPVVITDETGADAISIRPMMNLCLSFDHRLVDGAYAVQFMAEVRASLESWGEERY
ncbi:MAG: dihydrolipoamide acetyltransferase family protein [Gaiellaceae bacterium]|jgi:2-oxoglutarate dehydrogenase E2 component (dihydrolipoamide succinyltransferase)